jgi:hypothetical protein
LSSLNEPCALDVINENYIKSNMAEPGLKSVSKKRVSWADAHSKPIEHVQTFYLDEAEKCNLKITKIFLFKTKYLKYYITRKAIKKSAFQEGQDISKIEKLNEKELRFKSPNFPMENEFITEMDTTSTVSSGPKWPSNGLTPIDLPENIIIPEIKSDENEIQTKREQSTLAVLVFKQFCPDSASEPNEADSKSSLDTITKIIPLEDITLSGQTQASLQEAASMPDEEDTPMNTEESEIDSKNHKDFRGNNPNYKNDGENKYYNQNQRTDYRNYKNNTYKGGNSTNPSNNSNNNNGANSNSSNGNYNRGYYNQQHHQQQKRQQMQQRFQQQKTGKCFF